jgi:hypothetical protein
LASGAADVDVALAHYANNHMAASELSVRGVAVRYRPPGWERVGVYSAYCEPLDPLAPKSRYTLVEKTAWAPAVAPGPPTAAPVPLLAFRSWRIEPAEAAPRSARH